MKRQEITICNQPNPKEAQVKVVLFPKRKIKSRKTDFENKITNKIDIIELQLVDIDGNINPIQMTPDEALEIAGLLSQSVSVYLNYFNSEYKKLVVDKIKSLDKFRKSPQL